MDAVTGGGGAGAIDPEYCRSIEAYLCRKNEGHLIRIVGPAFERVCSWAERGVPLKVVYRGIDRYVERYYAKGPKRRPVRIEFCEADVLDVFDEWRRAVGVLVARERTDADDETADAGDARESGRAPGRRSLSAHLDRVTARLTALAADDRPPIPGEVLQRVLDEVSQLRGERRVLRGEARLDAIERLAALDAELIAAARAHIEESARREVEAEAAGELEPFRARMTGETYAAALSAAAARIVRERARLPIVTFD